ncbi:hypothetical protein RND71_036533 [Anisodus tanguticus]|uniref:3-hydroxyacyl-CoA dehydrogenase n=1 Tax=Anisodus tanguticus TaxID=243964 RepID=A0AAE1R0P8_9SOLA|nr:hypothetical protein RND71_036533 [Anisodus tanguticus]
MAEPKVTMEVGNDGVAVIKFSNPPVNALAIQRTGGRFSGGFDINVFEKVHKTSDISLLPDVSVDLVMNIMEDGKKPAVAAVEGLCLGGGLELALGCHARIAAPRTQLGLPELSLGVLPGSGDLTEHRDNLSSQGTQRLPRLIGLSKAIEMMMTSKPIMSEEGKRPGLIDAIVPSTELLKVARQWALDIAERRKPWMRSIYLRFHFEMVLLDVHQLMKLLCSCSRVPNVTDFGLKPRPVKKVAIIGGGLMGSGKATSLVLSNIFVIVKEINPEYLQKGIKAVEGKANKALSMVKGVLDYSEFKDVDMVIEAVIENISLKQSSLILRSPAHVMPLLEIVRMEKTSAQAILDLMAVGKTIKKVPVVVGNCTGFAVNRTFFPYAQSAGILANLGVDVYRIDSQITSFGLPIGPFQLQDLARYGVAAASGKQYTSAFPDRTFKSPLLDLLVKIMEKGYYIYKKGEKPKPDPSVLPIPISVTDQEIVEMILFPVVNEACRVLDDGIVILASDLDIASVLGMSFPSYRGGIVFWADTVGAGHIYKSLRKWSELYGNFFKPSKFLEERAVKGIPLVRT